MAIWILTQNALAANVGSACEFGTAWTGVYNKGKSDGPEQITVQTPHEDLAPGA